MKGIKNILLKKVRWNCHYTFRFWCFRSDVGNGLDRFGKFFGFSLFIEVYFSGKREAVRALIETVLSSAESGRVSL